MPAEPCPVPSPPAPYDYNIAFFTNTFLPFVGGVSNSINLYATHLERLGQHVLIYAPSYPDAQEDTAGVRRILAIPNAGGAEFSLPLPASLKPLLDFAEKEFDLVHVHHPFLLGETGLRMARSERIPLVFTYHTQYEQYTHNIPLDDELSAKALIKHATEFCEMCDLVIAPTPGIADLLRERGVTTRIEVLPSGIELARYRNADAATTRQQLGLAPDHKLILHVGRLAKEKNLAYLFTALAQALQATPNARFLIAGSGPDDESLRALLAPVASQVSFLGTVTGDALIALYTAADLFVFSSSSETQGMVLVEAMAGGTPVIALDADAMRAILQDNHNGRLLPADTTPQAYAEAVTAALAPGGPLPQWSEAARQTAQPFDMPQLATRLLQHYHSLKGLPRHRIKKETMTFGLLRNFLTTLWDELIQ